MATRSRAVPAAQVAAIRRFNRFYTRLVGALDEAHLHLPFTLAQARVLYELATRDAPTATAVGRELRLDAGYLSRLVGGLTRTGLVRRKRSAVDGRETLLTLTAKGRAAFHDLDARARAEVGALIAPLSGARRRRLLDAMGTVETMLGGVSEPTSYLLRPHRIGDMGYVVHRQAILYATEYGWNAEYESLVSRIVADFLDRYDATRERCWIAEREGETVGSVFLIRHPARKRVARLRLLYVEPAARGLGIGARLVRECTEFARGVGYRKITLWTNSVLTSARRLYESEGYRLVEETPHHSFGKDLVGQTWELELRR